MLVLLYLLGLGVPRGFKKSKVFVCLCGIDYLFTHLETSSKKSPCFIKYHTFSFLRINFHSVFSHIISEVLEHLCSPSYSERMAISSAHKRQPMVSDLSVFNGWHSSFLKQGTISDRKILNKRGLKIQPCFSP